MTQQSNTNLNTAVSQHLRGVSPQKIESWQEYIARISVPGYQSPPLTDVDWFPDDDLPLTPDTPTELHRIADALETQPDHSDQLDRVLELLEENNLHLGDIKDILKETLQQPPPLKPLPVGRGGKYVNL